MANHHAGSTDVRDVEVYIYSLSDPETGEVFYIGRSQSPGMRRIPKHNRRLKNRIANLHERGLKAKLSILRVVLPGDDSAAHEAEIIDEHLRNGAPLLNVYGVALRHPGRKAA